MHQVYVDIIVDAIIEQYQTEENFYSAYQISSRFASLERRPIWFGQ